MSVQSSNLIAGGLIQAGGFVTSQLTQPRQAVSLEGDLPKVEIKSASGTGAELLQHAVDDANKMFSQIHSDVQFVIDHDSNRVVVKLVEPSTGIVLNQYPTDHALAISKAIEQLQQQTATLHATFKSNHSGLQGLLFKQKS